MAISNSSTRSPRFHYPLGHSYSTKQKEAILQLADQYDVYLVEDDYLGDLDGSNAPSFHYLDQKDRVIYIKSFSTNLFSALRITSMILPQALLKPVLTYKTILDYDSNLIMQKALSLYIDNGMYLTNKKATPSQKKRGRSQSKDLDGPVSSSSPSDPDPRWDPSRTQPSSIPCCLKTQWTPAWFLWSSLHHFLSLSTRQDQIGRCDQCFTKAYAFFLKEKPSYRLYEGFSYFFNCS